MRYCPQTLSLESGNRKFLDSKHCLLPRVPRAAHVFYSADRDLLCIQCHSVGALLAELLQVLIVSGKYPLLVGEDAHDILCWLHLSVIVIIIFRSLRDLLNS